eukprot:8017774-Ditylum_brightwellii.AAC.1
MLLPMLSAPVPEPVFAVCVHGRPRGCQICEQMLERHYWEGGILFRLKIGTKQLDCGIEYSSEMCH